MGTVFFCIQLHSFLIALTIVSQSSGKIGNYTLTTKLMNTMTSSDPFIKEYLERVDMRFLYNGQAVLNYLRDIEYNKVLPKVPKTLNNFYSTLEHFMKDKCLIVVNNFEGVDIHPTIEYPLILRQFDIALGRAVYTDQKNRITRELSTLWVPKDMISELNGDFSTNYHFDYDRCFVLKYLSSIWPVDRNDNYCQGPKSFNFGMLSRPWQCEIQVDLFIPDSLFRLGKHTEIFDSLSQHSSQYLPSLRQTVRLLVDTKAHVDEYDWFSLAAWTIKQHFEIWHDRINNDVQITGHVICKVEKIPAHLECNIENFNIILPCSKCAKFINVYPVKLEHLSFYTIDSFEVAQKFVDFPTRITCHEDLVKRRVVDYFGEGSEFIKFPLNSLRMSKLKFSDNMQKLGNTKANHIINILHNIYKELFKFAGVTSLI